MPITDVKFENGLFYCREVGRISEADAQGWADLASHYAMQAAPHDIGAVVDANEVQFVTSGARRIFEQASATKGLAFGAIASRQTLTIQTARVIGLMAVKQHTYVFNSIEEAEAFAKKRIAELRGAHT